MSVTIFVEGGGDGEGVRRSCRQGFTAYCGKLAPTGRKPGIVACGGRDEAFDKFQTQIGISKRGDICALLVDSEEPVNTEPLRHLINRDRWHFPALNDHEVFLMVQAMEAWFLADRRTLAEFYGDGFSATNLPGSPTNVETIPKDDLERALKRASKACETKGEYHKVKHGFALLALISPAKVEEGFPPREAIPRILAQVVDVSRPTPGASSTPHTTFAESSGTRRGCGRSYPARSFFRWRAALLP